MRLGAACLLIAFAVGPVAFAATDSASATNPSLGANRPGPWRDPDPDAAWQEYLRALEEHNAEVQREFSHPPTSFSHFARPPGLIVRDQPRGGRRAYRLEPQPAEIATLQSQLVVVLLIVAGASLIGALWLQHRHRAPAGFARREMAEPPGERILKLHSPKLETSSKPEGANDGSPSPGGPSFDL